MSEIHKALLAAQAEYPALTRDGSNPHFRSDYVTLESLLRSVLPILNGKGVLLVQSPNIAGGGIDTTDILVTQLIHAESGELVETHTRLYLGKEDAQAFGSAMTYARRYALMGMLGLVGEDDDDGNAASAPAATQNRRGGEPAPPRPFDSGRDRIDGAIQVKGQADATALQRAQSALDPGADWLAIEESLSRHVFDKASPETPAEWGQWWNRMANAVAQAAGHGDLATFDQVREAYATHFNGAVIALSDDLTASEETLGKEAGGAGAGA